MFTLKRGATSGRNVTSEQKERAPRIKGNMPNLKLTQKRSVAKLEAMEDMNPMLDTIDEAASNEQRRYCYIVATIREGYTNCLELWDVKSGKQVGSIDTKHNADVTALLRNKDGKVITGSKDHGVNIFS